MTIGGASGRTAREKTKQIISYEYVAVGARALRVAFTKDFKPGNAVVGRRTRNQDWIDAVGMNRENSAYRWRPLTIEWDRVVVDVQGNTVTIDAPITCAIEKRWGMR